MPDIHLLHPIFNHLTIGLFLVLLLAEIRLFFKHQKNKNELLSILWIIFIPAVLLSISTGILSKEILFKTSVPEPINQHENIALFFLISAAVCGFLKLKLIKNKKLTSLPFLILLLAVFLILVILGFTGGELVYKLGTGVRIQ